MSPRIFMPAEMQGRRIPVINPADDPYLYVKEPGDYYGPTSHVVGAQCVWFLLPIARDEGIPSGAGSLHHVQSPPHVFREEADGSLTIRESILASNCWHGFLTKGKWELNKSEP